MSFIQNKQHLFSNFLPNDARGMIQSRNKTGYRRSCDEYLL